MCCLRHYFYYWDQSSAAIFSSTTVSHGFHFCTSWWLCMCNTVLIYSLVHTSPETFEKWSIVLPEFVYLSLFCHVSLIVVFLPPVCRQQLDCLCFSPNTYMHVSWFHQRACHSQNIGQTCWAESGDLCDLVMWSSCCLALRADKVSDRSLLSLSRRMLWPARASSTRSWCWALFSCCCSSNTCHHNRATGIT